MTKKNYNFEKAKALFGMGKTPRQIEAELKIPKTTIERKAKEQGWSKGGLGQLVQDTVSLAENLGQKSGAERDAVQLEAERVLKAKGYIENTSLLVLKRIGELTKKEDTLAGLNQGASAIKTLMTTLNIPVSAPKTEEKIDLTIKDHTHKVVFEVV